MNANYFECHVGTVGSGYLRTCRKAKDTPFYAEVFSGGFGPWARGYGRTPVEALESAFKRWHRMVPKLRARRWERSLGTPKRGEG